jgi:hypothetical protein
VFHARLLREALQVLAKIRQVLLNASSVGDDVEVLGCEHGNDEIVHDTPRDWVQEAAKRALARFQCGEVAGA